MTTKISPEQAFEVGVEAYIYLDSLITMDVTRRVMTNVPPGAKPGMGPAGVFHHLRAFPDAQFRLEPAGCKTDRVIFDGMAAMHPRT